MSCIHGACVILRCGFIVVDNMAACARLRTVISGMKLELGRDEMSGSDQDPPGNNTMPTKRVITRFQVAHAQNMPRTRLA